MKALRHAGIVVKDLEKMLHFYGDLLGLKVIKRMDESSSYIDTIIALKGTKVTTIKMSADDGSLIELLCFHSHPGQISREKDFCNTGISHIAFTVEDIDAQYRKLIKAGVLFISAPQNSPDGCTKVAFCRDYENNFIELVKELHSS